MAEQAANSRTYRFLWLSELLELNKGHKPPYPEIAAIAIEELGADRIEIRALDRLNGPTPLGLTLIRSAQANELSTRDAPVHFSYDAGFIKLSSHGWAPYLLYVPGGALLNASLRMRKAADGSIIVHHRSSTYATFPLTPLPLFPFPGTSEDRWYRFERQH